MDTQPTVPSADGVVSRPSPYPVDETVRRLDEAARGKGLTVFVRIDHGSGAREAGLDMRDEQVRRAAVDPTLRSTGPHPFT